MDKYLYYSSANTVRWGFILNFPRRLERTIDTIVRILFVKTPRVLLELQLVQVAYL